MLRPLVKSYITSYGGLSREVWLLSLIMLINRMGAMVLPFMSLYFTKELNFTMSAAGILLGAFGLGSIIGAYLGGQLTDKYGFYYVQLFSLLGSFVMMMSLIFIKDYNLLLVAVFLLACITDTLRPANSVAIASYAKPQNQTRSYSLMRFAINLGFSIGPALGGLVAEFLGYQWIFIIDGGSCLIAAIILIKYLPYKKPMEHAHQIDASVKPKTSAYRDVKFMVFSILTAFYAISFLQLITSVPVFWAQDWKYSEGTIGLLLALNGFIIVVIEMPIIKTIENYNQYMKMVALGCLMLVGCFMSLYFGTPGLITATFFIVTITMSEIFAMPFMMNYVVHKAAPKRQGQYMALYAMSYGVAHMVSPMGSLYVADKYGFHALYLGFMIFSLVLGLVFWISNRWINDLKSE